MKLMQCKQCGGTDFHRENGNAICDYCGAKYAIEESMIGLTSDIQNLLEKCRQDPKNARKYANLILDIDPDNQEALEYL